MPLPLYGSGPGATLPQEYSLDGTGFTAVHLDFNVPGGGNTTVYEDAAGNWYNSAGLGGDKQIWIGSRTQGYLTGNGFLTPDKLKISANPSYDEALNDTKTPRVDPQTGKQVPVPSTPYKKEMLGDTPATGSQEPATMNYKGKSATVLFNAIKNGQLVPSPNDPTWTSLYENGEATPRQKQAYQLWQDFQQKNPEYRAPTPGLATTTPGGIDVHGGTGSTPPVGQPGGNIIIDPREGGGGLNPGYNPPEIKKPPSVIDPIVGNQQPGKTKRQKAIEKAKAENPNWDSLTGDQRNQLIMKEMQGGQVDPNQPTPPTPPTAQPYVPPPSVPTPPPTQPGTPPPSTPGQPGGTPDVMQQAMDLIDKDPSIGADQKAMFKEVVKHWGNNPGLDVNWDNVIKAFNDVKSKGIDPYYQHLTDQYVDYLNNAKQVADLSRKSQTEAEDINARNAIENAQKQLEASGQTFSSEAIKQLGARSAFTKQAAPGPIGTGMGQPAPYQNVQTAPGQTQQSGQPFPGGTTPNFNDPNYIGIGEFEYNQQRKQLNPGQYNSGNKRPNFNDPNYIDPRSYDLNIGLPTLLPASGNKQDQAPDIAPLTDAEKQTAISSGKGRKALLRYDPTYAGGSYGTDGKWYADQTPNMPQPNQGQSPQRQLLGTQYSGSQQAPLGDYYSKNPEEAQKLFGPNAPDSYSPNGISNVLVKNPYKGMDYNDWRLKRKSEYLKSGGLQMPRPIGNPPGVDQGPWWNIGQQRPQYHHMFDQQSQNLFGDPSQLMRQQPQYAHVEAGALPQIPFGGLQEEGSVNMQNRLISSGSATAYQQQLRDMERQAEEKLGSSSPALGQFGVPVLGGASGAIPVAQKQSMMDAANQAFADEQARVGYGKNVSAGSLGLKLP